MMKPGPSRLKGIGVKTSSISLAPSILKRVLMESTGLIVYANCAGTLLLHIRLCIYLHAHIVKKVQNGGLSKTYQPVAIISKGNIRYVLYLCLSLKC